jgi:hypothetical protein
MRNESIGRLSHLDRFIVLLIALVLCAALAIVARPLQSVFDAPLEEDGYYILAVARRIALGQGVTYDGVSLTNGFQPLWTFLCAPLFWLVHGDRVAGVRAVLGFYWVLYALGALMVAVLFARTVGRTGAAPRSAGLIAALVFLSSPVIWRNGFNGLETSLSTACLLASILCYVSIDRTNKLHLVGCGITLGFLVLSRIDTVILVMLLAGVQLVRRDSWMGRLIDALCISVPAAVVSSPWWAYNVIAFGHLVPSSGVALQDWAPTVRRYLTSASALICAFTPQFDLFLNGNTWPRAFARTPAVALALFWVWPELRAIFRTLDRAIIEILLALALFVAFLTVWYPSSSWASFFYSRYAAPASILGVLFWALAILKIAGRIHAGITAVGLTLVATQIPALAVAHFSSSSVEPLIVGQVGLAQQYVPADDWVAGAQAGTLGFFRDRVVNLDGRVNFETLGHRGNLEPYLRERGIRWLADRTWILEMFVAPDLPRLGWTPVATKAGITLYHYDDAKADPSARRK